MKNNRKHDKNRCPYCFYGLDGELKKLCIDCYDEYFQPDDAFYDVALGTGPCEVCGARTYGEANVCFIHWVNAMDTGRAEPGRNTRFS